MFMKTFTMKIAFASLIVFNAVLASSAEESSPLIVGGVNAFPGEFPFIVSLQQSFLGKSIVQVFKLNKTKTIFRYRRAFLWSCNHFRHVVAHGKTICRQNNCQYRDNCN